MPTLLDGRGGKATANVAIRWIHGPVFDLQKSLRGWKSLHNPRDYPSLEPERRRIGCPRGPAAVEAPGSLVYRVFPFGCRRHLIVRTDHVRQTGAGLDEDRA